MRLDLLGNPFGASPHVYDALATRDDLHLPVPRQTELLRTRIAAVHGMPPSWIALANGIDELLAGAIGLAERDVLLFPPTDPSHERITRLIGRTPVAVSRSHRFAVEPEVPIGLERPEATALVMSPNDPTGTILAVQEAVRLARAVRLLLVDERHAAYSPRTLLPLVGEFDNVAVLRTFETWAGLAGFPLAYAVAPPGLAARIGAGLPSPTPATSAVVAALATLDDERGVALTVARVRDEKSRLFRMLRKLNMVRPYPSWANYVLTGIERGDRATLLRGLADAGIAVHAPEQAGMERFVRISATTPEGTTALKQALVGMAAEL